jgi:hypothetical protein
MFMNTARRPMKPAAHRFGDHAGVVLYQTRGPEDKRYAVKLAKVPAANRS